MTSIADVLGGRYHLVRLLGRGGMSDVYQAIDDRSGNTVAVKIVRSGDPEFVRRLTQEARALESFEHPGLIQLLDTGLAGDDAYLVMEFIDGPTLAETLKSRPLGAPATSALGARLAEALAYVHERGIVHRDVKPSNILQSAKGEAWLGDFGIAQLHDATTITAAGSTLGTVRYMAPEQLEGHHVGPSADIWSLGIVLLECLTGRRVYEGSPSEVVARRLAGPAPGRSPRAVEAALERNARPPSRPTPGRRPSRGSSRDVGVLGAVATIGRRRHPTTLARDAPRPHGRHARNGRPRRGRWRPHSDCDASAARGHKAPSPAAVARTLRCRRRRRSVSWPHLLVRIEPHERRPDTDYPSHDNPSADHNYIDDDFAFNLKCVGGPGERRGDRQVSRHRRPGLWTKCLPTGRAGTHSRRVG